MFGCVRVLFAYVVIAVWVCICLVLSLRRQDHANVPIMNFWIPGSPGAMILDRIFFENSKGCFANWFWCVVCELCLGVCVCCLRIS